MIPVEQKNIKEKISKEIGLCNLCGLCNLGDSMNEAFRKETQSPRFKAFLMKKMIESPIFFQSSLDNHTNRVCPARIPFDELIILFREYLINKGIEPKQFQGMVKNLKKTGTPLSTKDSSLFPF